MISEDVLVTCPSCGFSKPVSSRNLPKTPVKASCSKCGSSFVFDSHLESQVSPPEPEDAAEEEVAPPPLGQEAPAPQDAASEAQEATVQCPKCGYERCESDRLLDPAVCPRCQIVYAKWVPPTAVPVKATSVTARPIDLQKLVYPNESTLFQIHLVLSSLYWLGLLLSTRGMILVVLLIFFIGHVIGQSALISHLKGNGIRISATQFPELYERYLHCCNRLGLDDPPEAYLINGSGFLNAFASRFLGRDFVVLYSNVIHGLEDRPDAINFYMGHELGHIKRQHLQWGPWLWPTSLLPLVGPAYSRAREYTCDQYGRACCDTAESALRGLIALAAGEKLWTGVNVAAYVKQSEESQGFWMSFHELISDYPWIVKRAARIQNPVGTPPARNGIAWLLAFFVPRVGLGGSAAAPLVTVAIIGILAAIAIPQFQHYKAAAKARSVQTDGFGAGTKPF